VKSKMSSSLKAAFVCYLLTLPFPIVFGLIFLFRPEFMPYHAVAVGQSWSEVDPAFRIIILALMRATGGGMLVTACAIGIILFKAFRQGIKWAYWAIPVLGLISTLPKLYATIYVAQNTPASPPWMVAALVTILLVLGAILSMMPGAKVKQNQKNQIG
jgi:hypothetical protein